MEFFDRSDIFETEMIKIGRLFLSEKLNIREIWSTLFRILVGVKYTTKRIRHLENVNKS